MKHMTLYPRISLFTYRLSCTDPSEKDQSVNTGQNAQGETDEHIDKKKCILSGMAPITSPSPYLPPKSPQKWVAFTRFAKLLDEGRET